MPQGPRAVMRGRALCLLVFCTLCWRATPFAPPPRARRGAAALRNGASDWSDFSRVESAVEEYLADRSANFAEEGMEERSPLDPLELQRCGYLSLIGGLMAHGGYVAVSRRLDLYVAPAPTDEELRVRDPREPPTRNVRWTKPPPPKSGSLALGQALDSRLDQAKKLSDPEERAQMLLRQMETRSRLEEEALELLIAQDPSIAARVRDIKFEEEAKKLRRRDAEQWKVEERRKRKLREYLTFSLPQRLYIVAAAYAAAIAHGRATEGALALLPEGSAGAVDALGVLSTFVAATSAASTVACAVLARGKNRSAAIWGFKGLVAGLLAVVEVRQLERMPLLEELEEAEGADPGPRE